MNKFYKNYSAKVLLLLPMILWLVVLVNAQKPASNFYAGAKSSIQQKISFQAREVKLNQLTAISNEGISTKGADDLYFPQFSSNEFIFDARRNFEFKIKQKHFSRHSAVKADAPRNRKTEDFLNRAVLTQKKEIEFNAAVKKPFEDFKSLAALDLMKDSSSNEEENAETSVRSRFDFNENKDFVGDDEKNVKSKERFHWKPALIQSGIFLGIQHGFRLTQKKTTRELGGEFFDDWARSVKNLRGWRDGDNFFTNYIAHPLQGSTTGRIFINNSDSARKQEFGSSKEYWTSRMKAMVWSAFWSTQFEMGPISEASIGNVGLRQKNGYSTMAYVDLFITPVVGTGLLIGEDIIDKYILKNWLEKKIMSRTRIKVYRTFLTPTTSFVNLLSGRVPWKRDDRLR